MTADDRRALVFEIETPSEKPRLHPPRHPRWEKFLPAPWRRARRQRRVEAAFDDHARRVREWEAAGRPPVRTRHHIPAAEVTLAELPDGSHEVSATALPSDAEILSVTYPSQENPS